MQSHLLYGCFCPLTKKRQLAFLAYPFRPQVRRELLYQRQHLSYLMSLHEDVATSAERLQKACAALHEELGELEALIGLQSSVPKSQVKQEDLGTEI